MPFADEEDEYEEDEDNDYTTNFNDDGDDYGGGGDDGDDGTLCDSTWLETLHGIGADIRHVPRFLFPCRRRTDLLDVCRGGGCWRVRVLICRVAPPSGDARCIYLYMMEGASGCV